MAVGPSLASPCLQFMCTATCGPCCILAYLHSLVHQPFALMHLPCRSFASVRATGKELLQRFPTLDVLLVGLGCS